MNSIEKLELESRVIETLRTCYDPEIPVNIFELGLVYGVNVNDQGDVQIEMTLTSPNCPVAGSLPVEVKSKVMDLERVHDVDVCLVWEPPWDPSKMSEGAKLQLGMI